MSIVSLWGQNVGECNESHFLNISNKKVDVYKDTGLNGWLFIFLPCSAESELAWRSLNSHPFVCHGVYLYIANLHQANLMAQKREKEGGEKKLMKTQLLSGANTLKTKKTPYKKYLRIIYTWSGGSQQRSEAKCTAKWTLMVKRPFAILHLSC